jgi:antitoxin CcdA
VAAAGSFCITLELDAEVLAAARDAGLDLSELLSRAVRRHLPPLGAAESAALDKQWQEENREAIEAYNRMIEEDGFLFSDGYRMF